MNLISWTGTAKRPLRASRGMHVALGRPAPYRGFYKVHTSLFHAYRIVLLLWNFRLSIRLCFKVNKDSFIAEQELVKVFRWCVIKLTRVVENYIWWELPCINTLELSFLVNLHKQHVRQLWWALNEWVVSVLLRHCCHCITLPSCFRYSRRRGSAYERFIYFVSVFKN